MKPLTTKAAAVLGAMLVIALAPPWPSWPGSHGGAWLSSGVVRIGSLLLVVLFQAHALRRSVGQDPLLLKPFARRALPVGVGLAIVYFTFFGILFDDDLPLSKPIAALTTGACLVAALALVNVFLRLSSEEERARERTGVALPSAPRARRVLLVAALALVAGFLVSLLLNRPPRP
jgi:hypothetical protein